MLLALVALFAASLAAQTSRGTLTGIVTDASGAAVPNADVELANKLTGVARQTKSNDSGVYRYDAVDPGQYDVTIKAAGFKTFAARSLAISAAQNVDVPAQLEVGENVSIVEVSVESVQLQTESAVRGGTITNQLATELPMATRNPVMLAITVPGVIEQRQSPGIASFSVNGARTRSNNFMLDGTENNDISVAGQAFQVKNPDSVAEISVQTSNYDAEFGRAGGAVVNVITRSGTNDFHGTVNWLLDVTNDDAITNTLSADPAIKKRGKLAPGNENYVGATFGGRIIRDRTFFFTSYQERRQRASLSTTLTTLTANGRQQLRSLFPQGSNPRADLYLNVTDGIDGTGQITQQPMGPDRPAIEFGTGIYNIGYKNDNLQSLNRVDHRFSDSDLLSVRYGYDKTIDPTYGLNFPGFTTSFQQRYQLAQISETHIFSPSFTNEFRPSYNRIYFEFPVDTENPLGATLPRYTFTGLSGIGVAVSYPQGRTANNYQLQDTASYVVGKHSFRFGVDMLKQQARQTAPAAIRGSIAYTTTGAYSAFANFIDDFGGGGSAGRDFGNFSFYPELFRQAYFFQDRWKIRDNFTLSAGVRYEYYGTPMNSSVTPAFTGLFNIDPRTFTGPFNQPNQVPGDKNNFGPNLGFSWSPGFDNGVLGKMFGNRKSVIRGGYYMGYDSFFNNIASNAVASAPNAVSTNVTSVVNADNPRGFARMSANIPTVPRALRTTDAQTLVASNLRNPYYMRWNFGIQRELPWNLLFDISYVGSSGVGLFINEDWNPTLTPRNEGRMVLPAGFTSFAQLSAAAPYALDRRLDPTQGARTVRTNGGHSSYHSLQTDLTKRFSNGITFRSAYTWSKLLDNGSEIFTYNNTTSLAAVPLVFNGLTSEKAVSLFHRDQRFVNSYIWETPWLKSQRGLLGHVLGGWQLSGVTTFETGVPYGVSNGLDADGIAGLGDRPDFNPAGREGVRARPDTTSPTGYVNPDILDPTTSRPVPINPAEARYIGLAADSGRTGNLGRNTGRMPGLKNWNFFVSKNVRITERFSTEFRTEFYNAFNTPQYGYTSVSPFTPQAEQVIPSNVNGSAQGFFMVPSYADGGGRVVRYQLKLYF